MTAGEQEDFEQELVDQYALAVAAMGATDSTVTQERSVVFSFVRFLGRPVWTAGFEDAERWLVYLRRDRGSSGQDRAE